MPETDKLARLEIALECLERRANSNDKYCEYLDKRFDEVVVLVCDLAMLFSGLAMRRTPWQRFTAWLRRVLK